MRLWVLAAVAAVVTGAGIGAGTLLVGEDGSPDSPAFSTTPLESFDTTTLAVARAGFCDDVDPRQVEAALGGEPADASAYDNGDEVTLADGVSDVAHEFGCTWTTEDGGEARAWVFAPPVDGERAAGLIKEASRSGCAELSAEPAFGAPTVALLCHDEAPLTFVSYRGLFGDAWLTCELGEEPREAIDAFVERAGAWCVAVARAAAR